MKFYQLTEWKPPKPGMIVTQAFILCKWCNAVCAPSGGPGNVICETCLDVAAERMRDK